MEKLYIIKIGGNIIDDESKLSSFLQAFASIDAKKILVHGGGKLATRVAEAMSIPQQIKDGRRITDGETLKVITMVYGGYINKNIVAKLQAAGCNSIGLTGADGGLIRAHKRCHPTIDYGFVGDVEAVNSPLFDLLLQQKMTPVIAPVTYDNSSLLNTNADTIAQETAKAMCTFYNVSLVYCFEKKGVLSEANDDSSSINKISRGYYSELKEKQMITAGMIPKLDNAFEALASGVQHISIGHADDLLNLICQQSGTSIVHE